MRPAWKTEHMLSRFLSPQPRSLGLLTPPSHRECQTPSAVTPNESGMALLSARALSVILLSWISTLANSRHHVFLLSRSGSHRSCALYLASALSSRKHQIISPHRVVCRNRMRRESFTAIILDMRHQPPDKSPQPTAVLSSRSFGAKVDGAVKKMISSSAHLSYCIRPIRPILFCSFYLVADDYEKR